MDFRRAPELIGRLQEQAVVPPQQGVQRLVRRVLEYWLLPVLLLAAAVRFYDLTAAAIWGDEGSSLVLSQYSLGDIWFHAARDVHPPLYFMLLRGWIELFGDGIFSIRTFSALPGIVTVGLGVWLVALLATRRAAILAGVLLALLPTAVRYSQEVRMYALLGLLLLGATLALVYWLRQPSRRGYLVSYALLMTLAFYTHYFTAFCVLAHWLYLAVSGVRAEGGGRLIGRPAWWLANAAIVLLYLPWVPELLDLLRHMDELKANGDVGWEPPVTWSSLPAMVWQLLIQDEGDNLPGVLFVGMPLLLLAVCGGLAWRDGAPARFGGLLASFTLVPLLLGFAVSFASPVFIERYLTAYALGLPMIIAVLVDRWLKSARLVALGLLLGFVGLEAVGLKNNVDVDANDQISVMVDYVNRHYVAGDRIVISDMLWYLSYLYYNRTDAQPMLYTPPLPGGASSRPNAYGFGTLIDHPEQVYLDQLSALPVGSGRYWLVGSDDQSEEFAPLPQGWHKVGQFAAGGTRARLFVLCGSATGVSCAGQ
ncbi:glycosyltransferase family 39 protein [Pseudomonas protegens]|uniref:glycosyltransferase family 39 protein n=1 Tax=Pseudomonas protegens TaxID=380021 RepID=UPI003906AD13